MRIKLGMFVHTCNSNPQVATATAVLLWFKASSRYLVSIKSFRAIYLAEEKKEEGRERQMFLFYLVETNGLKFVFQYVEIPSIHEVHIVKLQ